MNNFNRNFRDNGSSLDWLKSGWDGYIDMLPRLLPFLLALEILKLPNLWLIRQYHTYIWSLLYSLLILTPAGVGLNLVYIKLYRRQNPSAADFLRGFFIYPRALAVSLALGLLTLGGLIAFILPGVILYLTFCLSEYALADKNTAIKESFTLSAALTGTSRGQLAAVTLLTVLIEIMAPETVGVTGGFKTPALAFDFKFWTVTGHALKILVFMPWLNMSMAAAYNRLLRVHGK